MDKQKILKIVNIILPVVLLALVTTAVMNEKLPDEIFSKLHPALGFLLTLLIITHISLNWNWIKNTYFSRKKK